MPGWLAWQVSRPARTICHRRPRVTVSNKVAQAVKISARSKWEALAELERLGLIEIDRRPRRSPRAVLLHARDRARDRRKHGRDRAQGVPILFSCSLT